MRHETRSVSDRRKPNIEQIDKCNFPLHKRVHYIHHPSILASMQYRRAKTLGGIYFFTVVTYKRQKIFSTPQTVDFLRQAFRTVKQRHPFTIDAIVVLPDHLYCIWTLPDGDANFSQSWRLIKSEFSRNCPDEFKHFPNQSRISKREQAIWQRRFWEHEIQGDRDFVNHVEYIHSNPVRHKLVAAPKDWEYSSFKSYVRRGLYPIDWGSAA